MRATANHEAVNKKSESAPDKAKPAAETSDQVPELNSLWSSLATHVSGRSGAAAPDDPSPIRTKSLNSPDIQRLCAECEDEDESATESTLVQTKLTVGAPNDEYEQEADAVADQVMRMPAVVGKQEELPSIQTKPLTTPPIQRLCAECEEEIDESDVPSIQTKSNREASQSSLPDAVKTTIESPGSGSRLNESIRTRVEPVLGADLSNVWVHSSASAQDASQSLNARAFTHRNNIFLGNNQSPFDTRLMSHEATHVVQQSGGLLSTVQRDNFETTTTAAGPGMATSSLPVSPQRATHEIVIMSGGPTSHRMDPDHDANPLNYATAARIRIQRLMESAFGDQRQMLTGDQLSWVIMRPPYRYRAAEDGESEDAYVDLISTRSVSNLRRDWDRLRGLWLESHPDERVPTGNSVISVYFVDSSTEFVGFMNNGAGGEGRSGVSYIGRFEYFGHGVPGTLWFSMGWEHIGSSDITFSNDDVSSLDPGVFVSTAEYRSWSCNTATSRGADATSFAQAWVEQVGGRFVGAVGRTTYEFILDRSNPAGQVLLSREESAHWETVTATGPVAGSGSSEGGVSEPPVSDVLTSDVETEEGQLCRLEIAPLEEPAFPGDLVCIDEGAGHINVEPAPVDESIGPETSILRGLSCACDKSAVFGYDAQTFRYIRRIGSLIKSAAKDKAVPQIAVAGSIADEYNTRRGHRVALDAAQDALLDSLSEFSIDVDRFFDIDSKFLNAMENDVGMANINVRTALELVQSGELSVPGSPQSSPRVTRIIDYLLTNRGTARTAAAVIGRAQGLFGPHLGGYSSAMQEAVLVTYFKQGSNYYMKAMINVALNPDHDICPGDGGCRVMRNRNNLDSALS
jgi:hypothetical protein